MRVGIIAAAGAAPSQSPRLGERDALLFRSRLELDDVGLNVFLLDPSTDLAEQLDEILESLDEPIDDLVLYASCLLAVLDDAECFLCLDPDEPDVGDALTDVVDAIAGQARHGTLIIADLRLDDPDADRNRLTQVLARVQDNVKAGGTAELIAAVRPVGAHDERMPSRLTAGLLEAIDERGAKLTARQAYAAAIQRTDFGSWPSALAYTAGERPLFFAQTDTAPPSEEPITDAPPTARPPHATAEAPPSVEEATSDRPTDPDPPSTEPTTQRSGATRPDDVDSSAPPDEPTQSVDEPPSTEPDTVPRHAADSDGTPTTPRVVAPAVVIADDGIAPSPPSERRAAATVSVPTHLKPSAPATLPKVMIGARAKKPPPPEPPPSEPPPSEPPASEPPASGPAAPEPTRKPAGKPRPLFETVADAPEAKRLHTTPPPSAPPEEAATEEPVDEISVEEAPEIDAVEEDISVDVDAPDAPVPPPPPKAKRAIEMTVEDHVGAGDLALRAGREDEALAQYKKALAKLGTQTIPLRAEVYIKLGELMRRQGKTRVAISNFDKALNIEPSDTRALAALIDLNAEAGNWRAVASAEDKFFAGVEDDDARFTHLLGSGDLWRDGAQDPKRARKRYEAARKLMPKRTEPLERLVTIHEAAGAVEHVLDLRRHIAAMLEEPRARAEAYFALGKYCADKGRDDDASASYELALDSDPTMLAALEVLAASLAEGQEWAELERVYEKMITSFAGRDRDEAQTLVLAELHHRLALLHRDHLEDPERALASLDEELKLRPEAVGTRMMAADLALDIGDSEALSHLRVAATSEPRRGGDLPQALRRRAAPRRHRGRLPGRLRDHLARRSRRPPAVGLPGPSRRRRARAPQTPRGERLVRAQGHGPRPVG